MQDDVRGYVSAAGGLTEAAADRAKDLAARLLAQGLNWSAKAPEVLEQIQHAADGLLSGQRLDPTALAATVREQVDLAIGRSGLVREEELAALRAQVVRLEGRLESLLREMADKFAVQPVARPDGSPTSAAAHSNAASGREPGTATGEDPSPGGTATWTRDV